MGNILYYVNPPPALPWDDFQHVEIFGSIDGITKVVVGGSVNLFGTYLEVKSGDVAAKNALCYKEMSLTMPELVWDKRRTIKVKTRFVAEGSAGGLLRIGFGSFGNDRWVGIEITDGIVNAKTVNVAGSKAEQLYDWSAGAYDETLEIEIRFFAAARAEFWINAALAVAITENIPTGSFKSERIFEIYAENGANAENKRIEISMVLFHQVK